MRIDVHVGPISVTLIDGAVSSKLDVILEKLNLVLTKEAEMAGELDALAVQVQSNTDAENSAVIVLGRLHDLLVAAGTDPVKLNDLKSQLATSRDKLAEAITANTPAS